MSEQKNALDFMDLDEDGLDIDAIFGGGSSPQVGNPFVTETQQPPAPVITQAPQPLTPALIATKQQPTPQGSIMEDKDLNPIEAAFEAQENASAAQAAQSLFEKPPVFSYGGVTESITDASMTFEELRIAKADDFPELSEGKKVTWTVEYGKVTKSIAEPNGSSIAAVKTEIEQSKAFLDGLKKAKEKERNPDCLIKPKVTAQSKGIAAYKGLFTTMEEARASDKVICLIPGRDGQVYEMRRTELGEFITPMENVVDFQRIRAGFTPALPLIPFSIFQQIISFFRSFMGERGNFEALAHIYWDKERKEYTVVIPKQEVTHSRVLADLSNDALQPDRYLHYADIHSHNNMPADFSFMDDLDGKATRLYFVVGRLDWFCPAITARVSCGGIYHEINPALVLEEMNQDFPPEWKEQVKIGELPSWGNCPLGPPMDNVEPYGGR